MSIQNSFFRGRLHMLAALFFGWTLTGSPTAAAAGPMITIAPGAGRFNFVDKHGDRDTDPGHKDLRKTPEATAQGANRFERGRKFVREARTRATEMKCPFAWQIQVVPGAAHQNSKMSGPAAAVLMGR